MKRGARVHLAALNLFARQRLTLRAGFRTPQPPCGHGLSPHRWSVPTATPSSVRAWARKTRSRFPSFPYRGVVPLARTNVIVIPPVLGPIWPRLARESRRSGPDQIGRQRKRQPC